MSRIAEFERQLIGLSGSAFEALISELIDRVFIPETISTPGRAYGKDKPTQSSVDICFSSNVNGKTDYFVAMTNEDGGKSLFKEHGKIAQDINKIISNYNGSEYNNSTILYCVAASYEFKDIEQLRKLCKDNSFELLIWGSGTIYSNIKRFDPMLFTTFFNIPVNSFSIVTPKDFIRNKSNNILIADTFLNRDGDLDQIKDVLLKYKKILLYGKSGCGKTRLALEVGKTLMESNFDVFVLKLSTISIIEELTSRINPSKATLLIIDDVNRFANIASIINYVDENPNIYLLMTVRDYLINNFKDNSIGFSVFPQEVSCLTDKQVKEIIAKYLGPNNKEAIDYILSISNANLRLATMSAEVLKKDSITFNSIPEVLDSYYESMIKTIKAVNNQEFERFLVSISYLEWIDVRDAKLLSSISEIFHFNIDNLYMFIDLAEEKEVIDVAYDGCALRISDQTLGNYLFYKYVFKNKTFIFKNLYIKSDGSGRRKLISIVISVCNVFIKDRNIISDLEKTLDELIANESKKDVICFMEPFNQIFPGKALDYSYNCLSNYDGPSLKVDRYGNRDDHYLLTSLLCSNSERKDWYDKIIDKFFNLFLEKSNLKEYLLKCVELFKVKRESISNNYRTQIYFIKKAISLSDDEQLFLRIFEVFYPYYCEENEMRERNTFTFIRFNMIACEGFEPFRKLLWECVKKININSNRSFICDIFSKNSYSTRDTYEQRRIDSEYAIDFLASNDFSNLQYRDLVYSVLSPYVDKNGNFKNATEYLSKIETLPIDQLFKTFLSPIGGYFDFIHDERKIIKVFEKYYVDDASLLNDIIVLDKSFGKKHDYRIAGILDTFFYKISTSEDYNRYVNHFLLEDGETLCNLTTIFKRIIDKQSFFYSNKEVLHSNPSVRSHFYYSLGTKDINDDVYNEALSFYSSNFLKDRKIRFGNETIISLVSFEEYKHGFIHTVVNNHFKDEEPDYSFFDSLFFDFKDCPLVLGYLDNDVELLYSIYLKLITHGNSVDYKGDYAYYFSLIDDEHLKVILKTIIEHRSDYNMVGRLFNHASFIKVFIEIVEEGLAMSNYYIAHVVSKMPDDLYLRFLNEYVNKHKDNREDLYKLTFNIKEKDSLTRLKLLQVCMSNHMDKDLLLSLGIMYGPSSFTNSRADAIQRDLDALCTYIDSKEYPPEYEGMLERMKNDITNYVREVRISELNEHYW